VLMSSIKSRAAIGDVSWLQPVFEFSYSGITERLLYWSGLVGVNAHRYFAPTLPNPWFAKGWSTRCCCAQTAGHLGRTRLAALTHNCNTPPPRLDPFANLPCEFRLVSKPKAILQLAKPSAERCSVRLPGKKSQNS
jgi:hypothetical protein